MVSRRSVRAYAPAGPARSPAAAGNARSRSQTLVVPAASAVGGAQVPAPGPHRSLRGGLRLPGSQAGGRGRRPAHDARWERDQKRDRWFQAEGYRVLRFSADEVFWHCEAVLEAIYATLTEAPPPPLRAGTSPHSGEEA